MKPYYEHGGVVLYHGDCLGVLKTFPPESVDAVVTDPPAGIAFMGKDWDRHTRSQFVAFLAAAMRECLRVLKPGSYGLVWAIPRTSHWTATALEEAGFEIRDRISHIFGTGFPKGKGCLKPACEDWWLVRKPGRGVRALGIDECRIPGGHDDTPESWAKKGAGGKDSSHIGQKSQAMRDAYRDGLLPMPAGRWPAHLVLSHHEDCRPVGTRRVKGNKFGSNVKSFSKGKGTTGHEGWQREAHANYAAKDPGKSCYADADGLETVEAYECVDGCPVKALDEQAGESKSSSRPMIHAAETMGYGGAARPFITNGFDDVGGPSRFFYCPKASRSDRGEGNTHPTVKNTALMAWLIKLVCPPGGLMLDPFLGSGSTAVAALREGRRVIGIEQSEEYCRIAVSRLRPAAGELPFPAHV